MSAKRAARASTSTWSNFCCENSALEDHGKIFYATAVDSVAKSEEFTPRRSARFRRIPEYPRETNSGLKKRRRNKRKKPDQSDADCEGVDPDGFLPIIKIEPPTPVGDCVQSFPEVSRNISPDLSSGSYRSTPTNKKASARRKQVSSVYAEYFSLNPHSAQKSSAKKTPNTAKRSVLAEQKTNSNQTPLTSSRIKSSPNERRRYFSTPQSQKRGVLNFISSNKKTISQLNALVGALARNVENPPADSATPFPLKTITNTDKRSAQNPAKKKSVEVSKIPVFAKRLADQAQIPKVVEFKALEASPTRFACKAVERQNKHRAAYKAGYQKRKNGREIIKGVRSNRRFELQMSYRQGLK